MGETESTLLKQEFNMWRKFYDGWFEYYYNIETGERKFKLEPGDKLVD